MKRFFLFLILPFLLAGPSIAQTQWYIGVGGNFNTTWIMNQNTYGEPELNYKLTYGYAGNFNLGFDFSDYWGFKFEIGYSQMGQKYDDTQYDLPTTRDIKLDYVLVPLMAKFRAGGQKAKFYLMAGPQLGILLKATQSYIRNGEPAPPYKGIDVSKEDIKGRTTTAAGFVRLDLGIELTPVKHLLIDIGLTNAFSITDLNREGWRFPDDTGKYKISHSYYAGLNLGINYRF